MDLFSTMMFCLYKKDFTDILHFKLITFPAEPEQQKLIKRIVVIRFILGYISNFIAFGVILLLSTSRGLFNEIDFSVSYFINVVIYRFHGLHIKKCIKEEKRHHSSFRNEQTLSNLVWPCFMSIDLGIVLIVSDNINNSV